MEGLEDLKVGEVDVGEVDVGEVDAGEVDVGEVEVDLNDLDTRSKANTTQIETIRTYLEDLKKKNMNKE